MSGALINIIIQLVTGVIGGNAVAAGSKNMSLGPLGNTIAGAIGGVGGGQLLTLLMPAVTAAMSGQDIGAIVGQVVAGGAGGAILTAIVGYLKNSMGGKAAA